MNKYQYAYLAGLMDGEGCLNINYNRSRDSYQARLTMTNTNLNMINWCKDNVGGNIYLRTKYFEHHKDKWEWVWTGDKDAFFIVLKGMLPFLTGKKEQCRTLMKFVRSTGKKGQHLTVKDKIFRKKMYERMKFLNATGLQRLSEEAPNVKSRVKR